LFATHTEKKQKSHIGATDNTTKKKQNKTNKYIQKSVRVDACATMLEKSATTRVPDEAVEFESTLWKKTTSFTQHQNQKQTNKQSIKLIATKTYINTHMYTKTNNESF